MWYVVTGSPVLLVTMTMQFAKLFIALSVVEPGINWESPGFRWSMEDSDPWIPGWECTAAWATGTPHRCTLPNNGDGSRRWWHAVEGHLAVQLLQRRRLGERRFRPTTGVSQSSLLRGTPLVSVPPLSITVCVDVHPREAIGTG